MLYSLFTFDLDVLIFHIFIGFIQYLAIFLIGTNFLKLFRESLNPILIYPIGLSVFCILVILFWTLKLNSSSVILILIIYLIFNYKIILNYFNHEIFNRLFFLILIICFIVLNNTTLHDPDTRNGIQAYSDTYFYISGIYSDLNFYKLSDLTMYNTPRYLNQQIGLLLAYPFRDFDLFRPILNFSVSAWILSLMFVVDILRKNIQLKFISYQTLILSLLILFSFRTNYYLDESVPTILTIPLIFLLSFFLFESFKREKINLEIFLFIIMIFLSLLTKQVLLFLAIPILFLRVLMSGKKKLIYFYSFLILLSVLLVLFFHLEHLDRSLNLIKIKFTKNLFFLDTLPGMHNVNQIFQLISLITLVLLSYKNVKLISVIFLSAILFLNSSSGGPYFFWMLLFVLYTTQKYKETNFLNKSINKYFLYFCIFLYFFISYKLFADYHYKFGTHFLFFIVLFSAFNIINLKSNLKFIILILAIIYPLSFSLKIPSIINFLIKNPLENGKSLVNLNVNIEEIVPKNSIIFTDIAVKNYSEDLSNEMKIKQYALNPSINYLTQSKRQFYLLSSYFFYDKQNYINKFYVMVKNNHNVIYANNDPKKIIKNDKFKNYFILIKKENLNKVYRLKKNINIIDNDFALIQIVNET